MGIQNKRQILKLRRVEAIVKSNNKDETLTRLITLEEAVQKRIEFKEQGVINPTIMAIPDTHKYQVIRGRTIEELSK